MTETSEDSRLATARSAMARGDGKTAHEALAAVLAERPADPAALPLMADLLSRIGRLAEAEQRLSRALALAPDFDAARYNHALVLYRMGGNAAARQQLELLLARQPQHFGYRNLHAAVLARLGQYDEAIAAYQALLAEDPGNAGIATSLGHAFKTLGRTDESIAAYRQAVTIAPAMGEAWWSLANLKTFRFGDGDIAAMEGALAGEGLADEARLHLEFALGKALEDRGDYAASFRHYAAGNARRRAQVPWDGARNHAHVLANEKLFTPAFFAARQGQGAPARDPIFIVGLPRSGSTLIEQILSSHSQIEGTMELPDMAVLARGLAARNLGALAACPPAELKAMGEEYLARTRIHRKLGKPYFIDKMPNNFAYLALIHLTLPNAIIIDARRDAMATCFSAWKQHFAHGQTYTYDLSDLGRFWRDYERLMAHFDRVLPGRVLRVQHEELVADTEGQVRRMLDHIGLPFEPQCLAFYENKRPVRTASAEQVRRPITAEGLEQWKNFEPWLGPLKQALAGETAQQGQADSTAM
jgi:tetratricopeptide (TPR) repeat protein